MVEKAEAQQKPIPRPDDLSRPFFDGAKRGALMIQRCKGCGTHFSPVRQLCTECLGEEVEWVQASGRGTLFTFGIMHQRYHPGFVDDLPYNVAVVELEEGPRLNTNIVGVENEALRVGMPVEVVFEELSDEVSLPKFRTAS